MPRLNYRGIIPPPDPTPPRRIGDEPPATIQPPATLDRETFAHFLETIGLTGMGGAGFPVAEKIRASDGIHTLVINAVECEPGASIDQAILLHHAKWVQAGAEAFAKSIGAQTIILAIKKDPPLVTELSSRYSCRIETFPNRYPAGAEKLIIKKLHGNMPPPGIRPHQLGYIVQNVCTLRAIGRALLDGIAVAERPLSVANARTGFYENIIAPIGLKMGELLQAVNCPFDPEKQRIVAGGLMMGQVANPTHPIEQITTSLFIIDRDDHTERDCIRCGACNDICPLGLHPIALVERIKKGKTTAPAFSAQMTECFLCGACSAVCPSDIPLVQTLAEGKQCLP